MSLDLFQDETQQAIDRLPAAPTAALEAPFFHNFLPGSMRVMASEMAKVGRSVSMAASVPMILADAAMGGTELQDRFFQQHDEVFGSAVKYWTPQPGEVGFAGEVVGSLAGMLPTIMANPALAVGSQVMSQSEDLVEKGVSPAKAVGVGVVQGAGLATGIWMPILGQNLWQRVVLGGAGFNVLQGVTTRAGSQLILEGEKAAELYPTFDAKMLTIDMLLGMPFGVVAHVSPEMRAQGKDVWARIANWAENLTPEQVDALAVLRQAEHLNAETAPGVLRTPADVEANVNRVKSALESLLRDEAPQVDAMPKPSLEPDRARQVDAETRVGELREDVARVVAEEGIPELQPAAEPVVRGMPEGWDEMAKLPPEEQPAAIGGAIERRLTELGVQADEAAANGAIWRAFFDTASRKYGVQAAELMRDYGIDLQRMRATVPGADAALATGDATGYGGGRGRLEQTAGSRPEPEVLQRTAAGGSPEPGWVGATRISRAGRPLPFYRGSELELAPEHFDAGSLGVASGNPSSGLGVWFTNTRSEAGTFGKVQEAYLDIRNPLVVKIEDLPGFGSVAEAHAWREAQRAKGHDGLVITAKHLGGKTHVVAFDAKQVVPIGGHGEYAQGVKPGPMFYSELARQIQTAKMDAAPAKGWKDYIRGLAQKGVKAEEVKWTGIEEWLDLQQGRVTRQQVSDFLEQNGVRVDEVMMGGKWQRTPADAAIAEDRALLESASYVITENPEHPGMFAFMDEEGGDIVSAAEIRQFAEQAKAEGNINPGDEEVFAQLGAAAQRVEDYLMRPSHQEIQDRTRYSKYQLPGAKEGSYRELLLTLPDNKTMNAGRAQRDAALTFPLSDAARATLEATRGQRTTFQSGHWNEDNILAHVRFNERTDADGRRVLFVEEIQSDWAQQGKKRGFAKRYSESDAQKFTVEDTLPLPVASDEVKSHQMWSESDYTYLRDKGYTDQDVLGFWNRDHRFGGVPAEHPGYMRQRDRNRDFIVKDADGNTLATIRADNVRSADEALNDIRRQAQRGALKMGEIPAAPFVQKTEAWVGLVLKRMIRYAAENGFDSVAWTRGEQQVDRYTGALRKAVDSIEWTKTEKGVQLVGYKGGTDPDRPALQGLRRDVDDVLMANDDFGFDSRAEAREAILRNADWEPRWGDGVSVRGRTMIENWRRAALAVKKEKVVDTTEKETALSDAIGKSMAERIINDPAQSGTIEGENIRVDDTGMASFYDRIVPNVANQLLKKLGGGKVRELGIEIPTTGDKLPELREATDAEMQGMQGLEEFDNGTRPVMAETRLLVGGRVETGLVVVDRAGVHILLNNGETEALIPRVDMFVAFGGSKSRQRELAVFWTGSRFGAVDLLRQHFWSPDSAKTMWPRAQVIRGEPAEIRPAGAETPQQLGFDLTPQMRERAMAGQTLFQRNRGQITFRDGSTVIGLFEGANASTFVHESGHLFLQITRDLALRADAPAAAVVDWARLEQWLGIEGGEINTAAHEQFARGWEKYLAEGEAPTPELRTVFQQFRDWLLQVYRTLTELDVKLTDEIRGVMDRMLASEAADPTPARARATTEAKGAPAPTGRDVPPPPRAEAGEARATPEAPEEPDPWLAVADAKAAAEPAPQLGLENEDVRAILLVMAETEAGWAEIGGRHLGGELGQPNFSAWVPRADWWPQREGKLNEAQTKEAVRKALAGEKLKKKEQLAIDYMVKIAAERAADVGTVGKDEWDLTAEAVHAEDLEPTTRNVVDAALVGRAMEISEGAVERLAVMYEADDAGFMAAVRRMIDAHHEESRRIRQDLEAARSRQEAGSGQPGPAGAGPEAAAAPAAGAGRAAGGDTGRPAGEPQGPAAVEGEAAQPDPLRQAAEDFVATNPGRHIMVGTNEDGTPRYVTAEEYLAEARAQAELARQDVGLFEVAARCMLGGS